jgi:hypothetical protein
VAIGVHARERRQDPARGVRDEDRVVVRQQRPVAAHELEQVWHLLEIGGDVGVVPDEVRVVEDQVDDVLDVALG